MCSFGASFSLLQKEGRDQEMSSFESISILAYKMQN